MNHTKRKIEKGKYEYRDHVIENQGYCSPYKSEVWLTHLKSNDDFIMEKTLGEVITKLDEHLNGSTE